MRTIGGGNAAQPTSTLNDFTDAVRVEVANASDALTDLSQYAVSLEYEQTTDEIVDEATIVFRRLEGVNSLAPLMTASPPVDVGRRVVVSINPGSGTYKEIFRGQIDDVDWPERFGDVTIKCRDRAGIAADTWVEDKVAYSTTAGVSLETVMQAVVDDNLTTTHTLNFPAATSAVVQHVAGDDPYGPSEQSTLDALRALAESIGWTIRWRHFDASASDWKWTVFEPSRSKTVPDHTFAATAYWDVTQIGQSIVDIRNVVEVEYTTTGGARARVTVEDATSIAAYGRRYMKISEASDSPINNSTKATALANAALSDLKDPDALLEIQCSYFWPGEVGVDLYRFSANDKHFSSNQDLAAMAFRHRIAVGERPTTWITCRGKPSGGVLMWRRRLPNSLTRIDNVADDLLISNFREVERTETTVTLGWDTSGDIEEQWVWIATTAQPVASDPWASFIDEPTYRLTAATEDYDLTLPDFGYVTYFQIVPVGVRGSAVVRGAPKRFILTSQDAPRLVQRATIQTTTATTVTVRVAVADPQPRNAISIAHVATGCTVDLSSPQAIAAGSVTTSIDTTGTVDYVVTRPAFQAGTGRVTFTASATDRVTDIDAIDIPAQERDTQYVQCVATITATTATQVTVTVTASAFSGTPTVGLVGVTGGATLASGNAAGTYTHAQNGTDNVWVFNRAAINAGVGQAQFRAVLSGYQSDDDLVTIEEQGRDTVPLLARARVTTTTATQCVVRVAVADPYPQGANTVTVTYQNLGAAGVSPASGGTLTPASTLTEAASTYIDYTIDRPAFSAGTGRVTFTAAASNRTSDSDAVDIPAQERDTVELFCRAKVQSTSATQVVFRVAVADYVSGGSGDVTLTYTATGCTINTPASPQTIASASITSDIDTTGTKDITIDRAAFGAGMGRVTFTATRTGRVPSTDSGDVPSLDRDTQPVQVRIDRVSETATQSVYRVRGITPNTSNNITIAYDAGGLTVSPASGAVISGTTSFATTGSTDFTITRPVQGANPSRVAFTLSATGFLDGTDGVDVPPQFDRFRCLLGKNTAQAITGSTWTAVTWQVETVDNGGLHDTGSNTSRITIPTNGNTGFWIFNAAALFTNPGGGGTAPTLVQLDLYKNGASVLPMPIARTFTNTAADAISLTKMIAAPSVGDYFELYAHHDGVGGNWGLDQCFFEAIHAH